MALSMNYQNAFTEVCEILNYLDDEEYEKIPSELISVFEKNRNINYEYELNDEVDLVDQQMLPETKAILFNLFRDYLSMPEQKEKIIQMQKEERRKNKERKIEAFSSNKTFEEKLSKLKNSSEKIEEPKALLDISKETRFFDKIKSFFRNILKK